LLFIDFEPITVIDNEKRPTIPVATDGPPLASLASAPASDSHCVALHCRCSFRFGRFAFGFAKVCRVSQPMGKDDWVLQATKDTSTGRYFSPTEEGRYKCDVGQDKHGKQCAYESSGKVVTTQNLRSHLKCSHLMETPEKAKQQSTQPKLNFHVMPTLSTDQKWAVYFACKGWAFRAASDPNTEVLREELMPNCPGRKQLSRHLTQAASILRTACLKQLKGPITLCYDSGTIAGSRYLLFVASTPSGACVVRCIRDSQLPGGKLTSVNIKSSIDDHTLSRRSSRPWSIRWRTRVCSTQSSWNSWRRSLRLPRRSTRSTGDIPERRRLPSAPSPRIFSTSKTRWTKSGPPWP
jgi:hypothetical protein